MRILLILIVILSYLGGIGSLVVLSVGGNPANPMLIVGLVFVVILNLFCARYLFRKASDFKAEWALFGAIGNINAILIYWLYQNIWCNWKEGKPLFGQ